MTPFFLFFSLFVRGEEGDKRGRVVDLRNPSMPMRFTTDAKIHALTPAALSGL